MTRDVTIMQSVYARNEAGAERTNARLTERGVFCVNVIGSPGAGKTTLLLNVIPRLLPRTSFVIEGDIQSDIDTQRLAAAGISALQINTGGACHLDAPMLDKALAAAELAPGFLSPELLFPEFLFIENIGNLVCPAEFLIGEHVKLVAASCAEGSDKPYKYPLAFEKADAVVLTKTDIADAVDFDEAYFTAGVRKLNTRAPIFGVSSKTGRGFGEVAVWLGMERGARV